jgi:hypothetical protein
MMMAVRWLNLVPLPSWEREGPAKREGEGASPPAWCGVAIPLTPALSHKEKGRRNGGEGRSP